MDEDGEPQLIQVTIRVPKERFAEYLRNVLSEVEMGYESGYVDSNTWWEHESVTEDD